jgi:nitrogen fixation NifU-like protein
MSNTDYNDKVKDHFMNPRNVGNIEKPDGEATIGNPTCGDVLKIMIVVKDKIITNIKFKTYGCAAAIATSSILTEMIKGKTIEKAKTIENKDVLKALGGLPNIKVHCSNLAAETLHKAIENYENKI